MRIPINLASQPFRRDRAMLAASITLSVLMAATLAVLISLILADRDQLRDVRADVARMNAITQRVSADQSKFDAVLRKPENAEVLERSVFLNELLKRKGISWTRIFADLEKILPYNVRIVQIHPSLDANDKVVLEMQFGAESPAPMAELLKAMGESTLFSRPDLKNHQPPTQSEPLWRFRVSVEYAQKL